MGWPTLLTAAPGAAADLGRLRHAGDDLLGQGADAVRLGERGAGVEQHVHRQRAFVERRQEGAREERDAGGGERDHRRRAGEEPAAVAEGPVQQLRVPALEPGHQRAVAGMQLLHPRQQVVGQHRRDGDRDDHAGEDGDDVGHAERREQAALDAGQDEQRHEHQHDDEGGVDDGGAHFQRRPGDDFRDRPRLGQIAIELEAAQDVLHAHHRIVHQFADGDGQAAQGHGVDGQAEVAEHQRGHQQRQRDRRQRDQRGTDVEQEQEEDHRHQDGAVAQRFLDVGHRMFDEVRLPEEELRRLDALRQ